MRTFLLIAALALSYSARAQTPQIAAVFPAGAQAGKTVEIAARGGNLAGARRVLVTGPPGVTAELLTGAAAPDETAAPLFQAKCTSCHEPRSPDNRTMTAEQWEATVDRMISARSAPITPDERGKLVTYLQAKARAGVVAAKVTVAPNAAPGVRELRLVTEKGVSTAFCFEVGSTPEVLATEPNSKPDQAQKIEIPTVVNGVLAQSAERDYFRFTAKKGERVVFDLKCFRLSELTAAFCNPVLQLYDSAGKEIAKNYGMSDLDPLLDWTAPADGEYALLVRDLLWKGNPASIYRLAVSTERAMPPADISLPAPDFALAATPDILNLGPGSTAALIVRVTRREGLTGPITVRLPSLPSGVSAPPAVIPPDDDKAILFVTAAPEASASGVPVTVIGEAMAGDKSLQRTAIPIEMYRSPANGLRPRARNAPVIGVTASPAPFRLEIAGPDSLALSPDNKEVKITVKVIRQGNFQGDLVVFAHGFPPGMYANPGAVYVPANQNEAVFGVAANGDARFLTQPRPMPNLPPQRLCFVGLLTGITEQAYLSTPPVTVVGK